MPGFNLLLDANQSVDLFPVCLIIIHGSLNSLPGYLIILSEFCCGLAPFFVSHNQCFNPYASATDYWGGNTRCASAVSNHWKSRIVDAGLEFRDLFRYGP